MDVNIYRYAINIPQELIHIHSIIKATVYYVFTINNNLLTNYCANAQDIVHFKRKPKKKNNLLFSQIIFLS